VSVKVDYEGTRRITTKFQPSEDRLYVEHDSSQFEKEVYERNRRARGAEQTGKGSVRLHLQMSEQDYAELCLKYPVLHHGNTRARRKAWERVAKLRPELVAMEFKPRLFKPGG